MARPIDGRRVRLMGQAFVVVAPKPSTFRHLVYLIGEARPRISTEGVRGPWGLQKDRKNTCLFWGIDKKCCKTPVPDEGVGSASRSGCFSIEHVKVRFTRL